MDRRTRVPLAALAAWPWLIAAAWTAGSPGLAAAATWWCLCLLAVRPAARRLGETGRYAVLTFAASVALQVLLSWSGALDFLAPRPSPAAMAAADRRAAVARSIAKALADGEAAWEAARAHAEGAQSVPASRSASRSASNASGSSGPTSGSN